MADCATQLWSQLCLDASLAINDPNRILISLSPQSSSTVLIRPLTYIPFACLQEIGITFHFSTCRRTRNASGSQVTLSRSGIQHTFASADPANDRRYYSLLSSPGEPQGALDDPTDGYGSCILGALSAGTSSVSSQGSVSSNTHSASSPNTPTACHRYAIQELKLEILVKLVDSSLRRMISDYKPIRSGGVVLSSDAGCPKLAAISPALFSPGYVKVKQTTEFHDAADGLIPGGFAAYWATSHDGTQCVSGVSPHKFQPLEKQAQAITRITT